MSKKSNEALLGLDNLGERIERMPSNAEDEKYVRAFLVGLVSECPMEILKVLARGAWLYMDAGVRAEVRTEARNN